MKFSHWMLKAFMGTLASALTLVSCGPTDTTRSDSQILQIAAPKGSFLELCRQSTAAA